MIENIDDIMKKAEELSRTVQDHAVSRRYISALEKIKSDPESQEVYARLVKLGKEISDIKDKDKELSDDFIAENAKLRDEIASHPLVTEFIESQKDYFQMMKQIQDAIRIIS
ncbi:MAG: YlbF family regulator [Spirochaetota bacterium]